MNNLATTNIHRLVEVANELTQQEGITRIINSFGVWQSDKASGQPMVFQVDVTIKEVGGEHTRMDRGFYFVPSSIPEHALLIAKSMATLDFFNSKYPQLEMETQVGTVSKAEDKVSEERGSEVQVSESAEVTVDTEQPKKTRKPRAKKEVVAEAPQVAEAPVVEAVKHSPYDNTKTAHKDALIAMLDKEFDGWRNLGKEKTKAMSAALVGKSFMDEAGVIISEFKELVKQYV
jgi:hypothetical protein